MSTPTPVVDNLLATADREWRALGIHRRDRVTLGNDLRAELEAASADGLDPAELVGADLAGFASRVAEEAGVPGIPPRYGTVLGVATVGALLALVLGVIVVLALHSVFVALFDLPRSVHVPVWLAAGAVYGGVATSAVAGAVLAVRITLREALRIGHTAMRMTLLLPPAVAASIGAAVTVGWSLDFSLTPLAIGAEVTIVLGTFLAATLIARRWSVRTVA